jgi:hypothetical protein
MLKCNHRFDIHCTCHLQSEYVMVGRFGELYVWRTVNGEFDFDGGDLWRGRADRQAYSFQKRPAITYSP